MATSPSLTYENLAQLASSFPGVRTVKSSAANATGPTGGEIGKGLLSVVTSMDCTPAYSYRAVQFVFRFDRLRTMRWMGGNIEFELIDLTDYCDGLRVVDHVIEVLRGLYEQHASIRLKIAAAECVGRFRGGLAPSVALFLPLLRDVDPWTRRMGAKAMGRAIGTQQKLMTEFQELGDMLAEEARVAQGAIESAYERVSRKCSEETIETVRQGVSMHPGRPTEPWLLIEPGYRATHRDLSRTTEQFEEMVGSALWTPEMDQRFLKLSHSEALNALSIEEHLELERLATERRRLCNSPPPEEASAQRKRMMESLAAILDAIDHHERAFGDTWAAG